ncbi:LPS export ABC transporter permease LptG [Paracoccus suum]|uniref:LPS export ABC transporter permease LptG n=1 Tax=Paracoccus suum TaxID=2259340 RepID=A0A344PNM2_9RHOB|nr:LPS export ABC transporter permease LptG [Paracoccus suum]AXC50977.1 LPS export ABC transporter permease LptG [Paracoccus suum]
MILSRYIAMRFLRMFLTVLAGFTAILFFVEMIEQMRRFSGSGVSLRHAAVLSALMLPSRLYAILALIVLLAAIGMCLTLSRNSELVAIRASGRSAVRFVAAPVFMAIAVGIVSVALLNPIVAATTKRYDTEVNRLDRGRGQTLSLGEGSVWLRQSLPSGGQVVIRAARTSTDATTLHDADFLIFDSAAGPTRRLQAAEATLGDGAWTLTDVKDWPLLEPNPEAAAKLIPSLQLPSDLTAARIRESVGDPEVVPIWQLPAFIDGLERAGFTARRHRVWLQTEIARPALLAAMVVIAASFSLRHLRGRKTGAIVLSAFGAGLGLFFLRHLAQVLGDNGEIPAALAAWAPPAAGLLMAFGRLLRLEDG